MSDNSEVQVVVLDPDDYEGFAAESVAFEEATFRGESPMKVRAGGDADEAIVQDTHRRAMWLYVLIRDGALRKGKISIPFTINPHESYEMHTFEFPTEKLERAAESKLWTNRAPIPTSEPERAEAYRLMRVLGYQHQPTVIHVNDDFDVLLPTLKVPVHTSFGIAEVKQIQAVNPKFGVDNVILTPESVTQLTDEEAAHIFDDYDSGVDVGWAVPLEGGYLTIPTPKYMSEHFPALKAANVPFENLTYNNLIGDYTIGWVRSIQRPTAHAKVGYDVIIGDYRLDSDRPHWVDDTFMHAYLWKSPEHKVLQKGEFIDAKLTSRKEYSDYADAKDVYEYIKTNEEIFEEIQRRSGYQIFCPVYPDYSHGFSVDTYTDSMPVILRRAGTAGQPRQNGAFIEMVNFGASPKAETITIKLT